jgi:iron(III) transport system permease protein
VTARGRTFRIEHVVLAAFVAVMLLFVLAPLASLLVRAFQDRAGNFAGLRNFREYIASPHLSVSFVHSLFVSSLSAVLAVLLGFAYAYGVERTRLPLRGAFRYIALLPLFSPTMMHGIGLVYLIGRKGMLTSLGLDVQLYGPVGIMISELAYVFPQAFMILSVSLRNADMRQYEAATMLGATPFGTFLSVTLPGARYGIISAFFACFSLAFTDFGAPKVVGGNYSVLATDIYKQVVGQQNLSMGAVVGIVLLVPALLAFAGDRLASRRAGGTIQSRCVPLRITSRPAIDASFLVICICVAGGILLLQGAVLIASLTTFWPYDLAPTFGNFRFGATAGGDGFAPLWTSLRMSLLTALMGTAFTFCYAYLVEKCSPPRTLSRMARLSAFVPLALPGLVIGLSYILFFNARANPLNGMYQTMAILVAANISHFFSVPYVTSVAALKKLAPEFEEVSESLRVGRTTTFLRVTVPMPLPAIVEIAQFFFVNSMATVSALVFLYSPRIRPASIAVVNMEDAGDIASAAAMSVVIIGVNLAVRALCDLGALRLKRRASAWLGSEGSGTLR